MTRWFCGDGDCEGSPARREEIAAQARREALTLLHPESGAKVDLATLLLEARREGAREMRERAAQILDTEVAQHRADGEYNSRPGHFCEDYGRSSLVSFAAAIRALDAEEDRGSERHP